MNADARNKLRYVNAIRWDGDYITIEKWEIDNGKMKCIHTRVPCGYLNIDPLLLKIVAYIMFDNY